MVERRTFEGGSNSDIDPRYLNSNQYIRAINLSLTKGEEGATGVLSKIKDALLKTYDVTTPPNELTCVGRYDDRLNDFVYYFLQNTTNFQLYIVRYDYNLNTLTNFSNVNNVDMVGVANISNVRVFNGGDDTYMVFTNGISDFKLISINRLADGEYASIPNISDKNFSLLLAKPLSPPKVETKYELLKSTSYITKKLFQFKYRWVAWDNRKSAWSPASEIALPYGAESVAVSEIRPNYYNVTVKRNDAEDNPFYKRIDVAFRDASTNSGDWNIFSQIDMSKIEDADYQTSNGLTVSGVNITTIFSNTEAVTPVEEVTDGGQQISDADRLYDYVPRFGQALENVDNRLVVGDCIINYDLDINEDELVDSTINFVAGTKYSPDPSITFTESSAAANTSLTATSSFSGTVNQGQYFAIRISPIGATGAISNTFIYRVSGTATTTTVMANLAAQIDAFNFGGGFSTSSSSTATTVVVGSTGGTFFMRCFSLASFCPLPDHSRQYKHKYGLIYGDEFGRCTNVITTDALEFEVPFYYENSALASVPVNAYLTIKHNAPSWATWCSIVYRKITPQFVHLQIDASSTVGLTGETEIDLTTFYEYVTERDPSILSSFVKGYMVRKVYDASSSIYATDGLICEITDVGNGANFTTNGITIKGSPSLAVGDNIVIYRPVEENVNSFWYEIGQVFPCSGGFHQFAASTYTTPDSSNVTQTGIADGVCYIRNNGDSYFKYVQRTDKATQSDPTAVVANQFTANDPNFSDFFTSTGTSIGNVNVVDISYKEVNLPSTMYYSEGLIPSTDFNGIGTFFSLSFKDANVNNGAIARLHNEGDNLWVYQNNKIGFSLVNKRVLYDGGVSISGNPAYSDTFLNDLSYLPYNIGISDNQESFDHWGSDKFFADPQRGIVLRQQGNSLQTISDVGKRAEFLTYFSNSDITNFVSRTCWGAVYPNRREYILQMRRVREFSFTNEAPDDVVTFPDYADISSFVVGMTLVFESGSSSFSRVIDSIDDQVVTLTATLAPAVYTIDVSETPRVFVFNWLTGNWTCEYDYFNHQVISSMGSDFCSMINKDFYVHGEASNYVDAQIEVPFNGTDPAKIKSYLGISAESNGDWIGADTTNNISTPEGQLTYVRSMTQKEGFQYSPVKRDRNTPNASSADEGEINGYPIRSYVMIANLKNTDNENIKLAAMNANFIASKLTYG